MTPTPLEPLDWPHVASALYIKREDLLPKGGGAKVRRFQRYFDHVGHVPRLVAMSDTGAHTHHTLSQFVTEDSSQPGIGKLVILGRGRPQSPYHQHIEEALRADSRPDCRRLSTLSCLLMRERLIRREGFTRFPIGGAISTEPPASAAAMTECLDQLAAAGVSGRVVHILPVASGETLAGLLKVRESKAPHHHVHGVMTGPGITLPRLKRRFRGVQGLSLRRRGKVSWETYRATASEFWARSEVWLDPQHMIHTLADLLDPALVGESTIVLWMTGPKVDPVRLGIQVMRPCSVSHRSP